MAYQLNQYNYQQVHDKKLAESVSVAAVVQVLEFDPVKLTVNVQPISKHLENGKYESQPPILQIPVAVTHCADFIFRPWYKKGDVGVVLYIDHDLESAVTKGAETEPSTERNHSTTDAVFVGGIVAGDYSVKGIPYEGISIAKDDGEIYVTVKKDRVLIKGDVYVKGNVYVTEKVVAKDEVVAMESICLAHHPHTCPHCGSTAEPIATCPTPFEFVEGQT